MSLLFGALCVPVHLHPLAFAFTGTETPGKKLGPLSTGFSCSAPAIPAGSLQRHTQGKGQTHSIRRVDRPLQFKNKTEATKPFFGSSITHRKV